MFFTDMKQGRKPKKLSYLGAKTLWVPGGFSQHNLSSEKIYGKARRLLYKYLPTDLRGVLRSASTYSGTQKGFPMKTFGREFLSTFLQGAAPYLAELL